MTVWIAIGAGFSSGIIAGILGYNITQVEYWMIHIVPLVTAGGWIYSIEKAKKNG